jgi:DNA-binding MarR family transcriptional regulator
LIVTRFDNVIHAPNRLWICAILAAVDSADFATVREGLAVSDSVLSKHVALLQTIGYVAVEKRSGGARRRTSLSLTPAGRRAFDEHVAALREITDGDAGAKD